MAILVIFV